MHGATQALATPVARANFAEDPATRRRSVSSVTLASGQTVHCRRLAAGPGIVFDGDGGAGEAAEAAPVRRIARCIAVADGGLRGREAVAMVTFAPGTLAGRNPRPVRALQVGSGARAAPAGRVAFFFCAEMASGSARETLATAVATLLDVSALAPVDGFDTADEGGEGEGEGAAGAPAASGDGLRKPQALAAVFFEQHEPTEDGLAAVAANCVRFPGGGASPTLEAEVAMAEAALGRLFGGEVAFFPEDDAPADEWELEEDREDAELLAGILARVSKPAAAEAGAATSNDL